MEPVFTLPYSEYAVANRLADIFKKKDGYSLYAPLSRQEKGVDLLLTKRNGNVNVSLTIQVKSSRTYTPPLPKNKDIQSYTYYTWFNTFKVPKQADIIILVGLYPPEENRTKKMTASWWSSLLLVFSQDEMSNFIESLKTKKGKVESKFGFGFDDDQKIILTRGGNYEEYTSYKLENRIEFIRSKIERQLE